MAITAKQVKELRDLTGAGMLDCKKALVDTEGNIEEAIDWLRKKGIAKAAKKSGRIAAEGLTSVFVKDNKAIVIEINSETDFVAQNDNFKKLVNKLSEIVLNNNPKNLEAALKIIVDGKTVNDLITDATATIGEKIALRRFEIVTKDSADVFGPYIHMGGKISTLIVLKESTNANAARDIAMHVAAMKPAFIDRKEIGKDFIAKETVILKEQALSEGKKPEIVEKMVIGRLNKQLAEICLVDQPFVKNPEFKVGKFALQSSKGIATMIRFELGEGIVKNTSNFADEVSELTN